MDDLTFFPLSRQVASNDDGFDYTKPISGGEKDGVKPILQHRYKYKNQVKAFAIINIFCLKTRIKICTTLIMQECKKNGSVGSSLITPPPLLLTLIGCKEKGLVLIRLRWQILLVWTVSNSYLLGSLSSHNFETFLIPFCNHLVYDESPTKYIILNYVFSKHFTACIFLNCGKGDNQNF